MGKEWGDRKCYVPVGVGTKCSRVERSHIEQPEPPGGWVVSLQTSLQDVGEERLFIKFFKVQGPLPMDRNPLLLPELGSFPVY